MADMGLLASALGLLRTVDESLFMPAAHYTVAAQQVVILEHGRNPSTDYYLAPRCAQPDALPCTRIDIERTEPGDVAIAAGSFVVIVRYLNSSWADHLHRLQAQLAGVAYFMDDDLPAARNAAELPLRYRYKIHRLFHRQRAALGALCSEVWVSTRPLAEKYAVVHPVLLPPAPLLPSDTVQPLVYFYHGSASHRTELRWLRDIVAAVQEEEPRLTFIAIGDDAVRRLYAPLPRTLVLHPMAWETYRDSLPALTHHIGLAPLLPGRFNTGRSATRFFDFTRLGAAGVYTDVAPYADVIHHGQDGLLLPNHQDAWRRAILDLAVSPQLRAALAGNASRRMAQLGTEVRPLLSS